MTLVPAELLDRLQRVRLIARGAEVTAGVGERRSKVRGSGIEFMDHRPMQPGEDMRHVDRHLYARLGTYHVRQYMSMRQLSVSVLLDASASMLFGSPEKFATARSVAAAFAFVALAGGDKVRIGALAAGPVRWSPNVEGRSRFGALAQWLAGVAVGGQVAIDAAVADALRPSDPPGLVVVVTDAASDDAVRLVPAVAARGHEILLVHLLAPEEVDPSRLGVSGEVTFEDAEDGSSVDGWLTGERLAAYRTTFDNWCNELEAAASQHGGRYLRLTSDVDVTSLFCDTLALAGVVR
jgi:uncharacterized protein (DUF58 family)